MKRISKAVTRLAFSALVAALLSACGSSSSTSTTTAVAPTPTLVGTFTDADSQGTRGDYTATIIWGNGNNSGGDISSSGSGFKVTGTNTYGRAGTYNMKVYIYDAGGSQTVATGAATVTNVAPTVTLASIQSPVQLGQSVAVTALATDPGTPYGDQLTYAWTVTDPNGTVVASPTGINVTSATVHATTKKGTYTITVRVTDSDGGDG